MVMKDKYSQEGKDKNLRMFGRISRTNASVEIVQRSTFKLLLLNKTCYDNGHDNGQVTNRERMIFFLKSRTVF